MLLGSCRPVVSVQMSVWKTISVCGEVRLIRVFVGLRESDPQHRSLLMHTFTGRLWAHQGVSQGPLPFLDIEIAMRSDAMCYVWCERLSDRPRTGDGGARNAVNARNAGDAACGKKNRCFSFFSFQNHTRNIDF